MMWTSINHQRQNLKKWSALYQITLLVHPGQQAVASPYIIPVYKGSTFHNNPMMTRNLSSQRVFIKSIAQLLPQHEQIIGLLRVVFVNGLSSSKSRPLSVSCSFQRSLIVHVTTKKACHSCLSWPLVPPPKGNIPTLYPFFCLLLPSKTFYP